MLEAHASYSESTPQGGAGGRGCLLSQTCTCPKTRAGGASPRQHSAHAQRFEAPCTCFKALLHRGKEASHPPTHPSFAAPCLTPRRCPEDRSAGRGAVVSGRERDPIGEVEPFGRARDVPAQRLPLRRGVSATAGGGHGGCLAERKLRSRQPPPQTGSDSDPATPPGPPAKRRGKCSPGREAEPPSCCASSHNLPV